VSVILINPFEAPPGREDDERAIDSEEFQRLTAGTMERFPHDPGLYEIIRT
jgi:hypothetical protein